MIERPLDYHFAIVWNTDLKQKNFEVQGTKICQNTILPEDPRVLYGTNNNDKRKLKIQKMKEIVEYDKYSTKQTVRFAVEEEEVELSRDVRIIVWRGLHDTINLSVDEYKIVSPQVFKSLVKASRLKDVPRENVIEEIEEINEEENSKWIPSISPQDILKKNIFEVLNLEMQFN